MATTSDPSASFEETDTRNAEMHSTIENWIDDLVADVDEAKASEEFKEWLDIQSQFHYSPSEHAPDHPPVSPGDKNRGLQHLAERVRPARPGR